MTGCLISTVCQDELINRVYTFMLAKAAAETDSATVPLIRVDKHEKRIPEEPSKGRLCFFSTL